MAKITNTGIAARGINIRGNDDAHGQLLIMPGETADVDLFDPTNPVYKGWQDAGMMDFAGALQDPKAQPKPKPEPAKPSKAE